MTGLVMSKMSNRSFTILTVSSVVLFGVVLYGSQNGWFSWKREVSENQLADLGNEPKEETIPEGYVKVGGVIRPATDIKSPRENNRTLNNSKGYHPGASPRVNPKSNPNTRSVYESIGDPKLAYRSNSMIPAPKFDRDSYEADPQAYLDEMAPGRIWQSLPPGENVVPIERSGQYIQQLVQGESVKLSAKAEPGMPVTFHSSNIGQFENQLSSITVRTGDDGIASATFRASAGTRGEIDLIASSPVHSDLARWLVEVIRPVDLSKTDLQEVPKNSN